MYKMLGVVFVAFALSSTSASIVSTQFHSQDGHGGYSYGHSGGPSSKTEHGSAGGVVSGSFSYVDGHGVVQTATYSADPHTGFKIHASNLPVAPVPAPVHAPVPEPSYYSVPVHRPLGVPVVDTPEVAAAKAAHLAAVEHQKLIVSHPYRRRRDAYYSAHPTYGFSYKSSTVHKPTPVYQHEYPHAYPHAYPLASHTIGVPVTDTPEVAVAKSAHLAAVEHAKATLPVYAPASDYYDPYVAHPYPLASHEIGVPVTDTPEVSAAKSAHLAAVAHAKATIPVHAPVPEYYKSYEVHAYPLASHEIGVPVTDTPEVSAAKSAHLSAVAHAKSSLGVY